MPKMTKEESFLSIANINVKARLTELEITN